MTEPSVREVALVNPSGTGRATPSIFEARKPNPITINIPSEHTRQRRRTPLQLFPAAEGWFFSPSVSQTLVNKPMRIRKKKKLQQCQHTQTRSTASDFCLLKRAPIYHNDNHSRRRALERQP
jgi:hypothetical protein